MDKGLTDEEAEDKEDYWKEQMDIMVDASKKTTKIWRRLPNLG